MCFQIRPRYGNLIVCDICNAFGAIGDRDWRLMGAGKHGQPSHLCRVCRPAAAWCAAHQQYHLRESLQRQPYASCGRLFTSRFSQQVEHCPQCRSEHVAPPIQPRPNLAAAIYLFFVDRRV